MITMPPSGVTQAPAAPCGVPSGGSGGGCHDTSHCWPPDQTGTWTPSAATSPSATTLNSNNLARAAGQGSHSPTPGGSCRGASCPHAPDLNLLTSRHSPCPATSGTRPGSSCRDGSSKTVPAVVFRRNPCSPPPRWTGPFAPGRQASYQPPGWARYPRVWERAAEISHGPSPELPQVLVHRDFHPGNVRWRRGMVCGVVAPLAGPGLA
jgi:hypothetical protein